MKIQLDDKIFLTSNERCYQLSKFEDKNDGITRKESFIYMTTIDGILQTYNRRYKDRLTKVSTVKGLEQAYEKHQKELEIIVGKVNKECDRILKAEKKIKDFETLKGMLKLACEKLGLSQLEIRKEYMKGRDDDDE